MNKEELRDKFKDETGCNWELFMDGSYSPRYDYVSWLERKLSLLENALVPSGETKGFHSGEYSWEEEAVYYNDDTESYEDYTRKEVVPWTTIKDIMKGIKKYAEGK